MKKKSLRLVSVLSALVLLLGIVPFDVFGAEPSVTVSSLRSSTLAPGVTQDVAIAHNADGGRVAYYVASADINRDDVGVFTNYKDNQCTELGMQKLSDQVAAAEKNHSGENYTVVASCNSSFYNMVTGCPIGAFVMNGVDATNLEDKRLYNMSFFAILKDGTPIIAYGTEYESYRGKMQEAVAGRRRLIEKGKICAGTDKIEYTSRSTVGITADGRIIMMVADGKQAPVSVGLSNYEQALIMLSYGCVEALEFDNGGSATYGSRPEGENAFRVLNTPSDGYDRSISSSLMIVSTAAPSGVFDHAVIKSNYSYLTPYSSVELTAIGADSISKPAPLPEDLSFSLSDSSMGSIEDGVFTAGDKTGEVTVNAISGGKVVGSTMLNVVYPDELKFTTDTFSVKYGSVNPLPVEAFYNGNEVVINENDVYCITGPADALIEKPELYGYVEGLDYYAPQEGCGVRCTYLNAILMWVLEDEEMDEEEALSYIITTDVELRRDNETVFDFQNISGGDKEFAWKREVSNATTLDGSYYEIENKDEKINVSYTFGIDLRQLGLPPELAPMWDTFGSALGDSIWEAMLKLSNKVDPKTSITVKFHIDPSLVIGDVEEMTFNSELFLLDRDSVCVEPETNTIVIKCKWNSAFIQQAMNQDTGAIDIEAVNPVSVLSNVNFTVADDARFDDEDKLDLAISGDISYDLIMLSGNAYKAAGTHPTLIKYQYVDPVTGSLGIDFYNTYRSFEDNFTVSESRTDGWVGDMYFIDGKPVTGQMIIDGRMCTFDDNGIYQSDFLYTGFYKAEGGWMYFMDNEPLSGWVFIDKQWYYFKSDFYAATGVYTINGMDYKFEGEQGKSIRAWNGRRFYYCRTYYKNEWAVIDGERYYFDNSGYRYQDGKYAVSYVGSYLGAYEFDSEGRFVGNITSVFKDSNTGIYYYSEDGVLFNGGLLKWNGDYYYAKSNYSLAVSDWYVSESNSNGLMSEGTYRFGDDARMVMLNGVVDFNGALGYYIDNVPQYGLGLVKFEDNYYYVRGNGRLATGSWYISTEAANGYVPKGTYEFGSDGKMVLFTGIAEKDGYLYYYVKNVPQYGLGLVKFEDNYYYVRGNGHLATESWYVSEESANGYVPKGTYEFGSDGKMVLFTGIKNENGTAHYYVDSVQQFGSGIVRYDGSYYFIRSNGAAANAPWYVSASAANGWFGAGNYTFGADGKMITDMDNLKPIDESVSVDENRKLIVADIGDYSFIESLVTKNDSYCTVKADSEKINTGTGVSVFRNSELVNSYTVAIRGDVNADGYCDAMDAMLILCISSGMLDESKLGTAKLAAADINSDGLIDEADYALAVSYGIKA